MTVPTSEHQVTAIRAGGSVVLRQEEEAFAALNNFNICWVNGIIELGCELEHLDIFLKRVAHASHLGAKL